MGGARRPGRAPWLRFIAATLLFVGLFTRTVAAEEVALPVSAQAELLVKVAEYDRNFSERARDRVHVVLLVKPNDTQSAYVTTQMSGALGRIGTIGGLPHDETIVPYAGANELAELCRARHVAIIYVAPGLGDEVGAIRKALNGVDVLTATGVPDYVPAGIVLGFDVVSGKPKLLVHLTQARLQNVALRAEVLKLMKVYE
jgi:hypothetical protein